MKTIKTLIALLLFGIILSAQGQELENECFGLLSTQHHYSTWQGNLGKGKITMKIHIHCPEDLSRICYGKISGTVTFNGQSAPIKQPAFCKQGGAMTITWNNGKDFFGRMTGQISWKPKKPGLINLHGKVTSPSYSSRTAKTKLKRDI